MRAVSECQVLSKLIGKSVDKVFSYNSDQEVLHVCLDMRITVWVHPLHHGTASILSSKLLHADADPAERKGRPATKILLSSAALADLPKQHAVPKKKGRPPAALGDSRASGGPHSKSLAPVPLNGPVRETPRSSEKHLRIASATEPQGKHGEQQPADEALQAKRRKLSKKARELAPGSLTGGRADGSHAESMPGIPASGAAEMTWKQLDKRMDVKRGRFSESEKETLLHAIKVGSAVTAVRQHPCSPGVATIPHPFTRWSL